MTFQDDTEPKRPQNFPPPSAMPPPQPDVMPYGAYPVDEGPDGPGCLVWGCMGAFSSLLALGMVILAGFAGWTEGLQVAQVNATATREAGITVQCDFLRTDLQNNNSGLAQRRLEALLQATPSPGCLLELAPTATAVYLINLPTNTPTITPSPQPTVTPTLAPSATLPAEITAEPAATTEDTGVVGGFDLAALLNDAQNYLAAGDYADAIDTLDAISAIDPTYQKTTIDQLLYQALTTRARQLYRSNGNLAEAILLTGRAEEYGDIGELNFERTIARYYLNAQTALDVNYSLAIRNLSYVVSQSPGYRNAADQLYEQYVAYGDALALGGDACNAVSQYNAALSLRPAAPASLSTKRDEASATCSGQTVPVTPVTGDAGTGGSGTSSDPAGDPAPPPPTPTPDGVAPIGVQN